MYFIFQKVERQFDFSDVNQELLQSVHQQRKDFIGQKLDTHHALEMKKYEKN
ncbi:hypothetical protein MKY89_28680 [Bacillus sp. FSL W7-1294]|uniref:hypothetical protein n=1 Tax=Bacillus cereus group TaxID=86661 RepID=UPI000A831B28|nr:MULTISPECIES: hypothetical protein [Bacillus cereus group]MED2997367.1 hypothetical protein [Bacillus tropicus]